MQELKIMRAWDRGRNTVAFVHRNPDTGRVNIGEEKFDWYFYIKTSDYEKYRAFFLKLETEHYVRKTEADGARFTRIYVDREHASDLLDRNMEWVWEYRDRRLNEVLRLLEQREVVHYEADLSVAQRWIISKGIKFESEVRVVFLDIETNDEKASGQPVPGEFQILSCAFVDGQTGKEGYIVLAEETDEAEKEFLEKLAKIINGYDVLVAFNGDNFDFPYIKARMARYGIVLDWRKKFLQDHLWIYKKLGPQLASYSLDAISKATIQEGKVEHGKKIFQLYRTNRPMLREYNLQDARLMYKIEQKTKYLAVAREVNVIGSCSPDDIHISKKIDMMLLHQVFEDKEFHFKTKVRKTEEELAKEEEFEGAFVFEPVPGFYENVKVLDFSSLYPNIIKTFNISPDTIVTKDNEADIPPDQIITHPTGHRFRKDFVGIIPKVIASMADQRNHYKELLKTVQPGTVEHKTYDRLQYVFKYFGLSFYGVMGLKTSRFYDVRIAESVTLGGQYFTKTISTYLHSVGIHPIYGDSVTPERNTVIFQNGNIFLKSFQELWDMATFFEMRGTKEIAVFNTPTFVLSHNFKTGKSEFNQINEIIRHLSGKKVYTYRSVNGVTRVTEDHSLIDDLGNEFKPTEMKDAKKVKVCKYNKKLDGKIDLFAYIGSYSYLSRKMRTLVAVGDKVLFEDNENRFFDRYLDVLDESRVKSLLRLTAHYICNGSSSTPETTKSRLGASIASENEVLINQLRDDYAEWFHGYNVNVLPPDYSQRSMNNGKWNIVNRCFKLQMMNALSAVIFKQMCGQKYHGKKIPDFVYMLDEKYQRYFLSLLIDGDGTVEKKSIIEDQFRFETGSLKLISGISLICDILEIKTAILYKAKQRTYTIRSREKDSNAWLVKKSCNEEEYGGYVYDLSVANVHNFVDACGNILLHNTDSLMFVLKKESIIPTLISNIHKVCAQHAKKFGCKTCTLDMAYDKGFRKFVILAKKRYAGTLTYLDGRILEVPKLYVAGLEYKRTDQCQMVRKKQEELLNLILNPDRMLGVEEARDFIDKLKQYVLSGEVSIEEITFSQKITKTLDEYEGRHMHKMVAQEMMADGKEVWVTDKIPYFIENIGADGKPVPRPTYKFAGKFARSHYWNNKIFPPLRRVLEVVFQNVNWDSYEVGGKKASQAQQGRMGLW